MYTCPLLNGQNTLTLDPANDKPHNAPTRAASAVLFRRRPIVRLALARTAPGVERIIHRHAVAKHLVVVGKDRRQAQRDCEQAARMGRQIEMRSEERRVGEEGVSTGRSRGWPYQ